MNLIDKIGNFGKIALNLALLNLLFYNGCTKQNKPRVTRFSSYECDFNGDNKPDSLITAINQTDSKYPFQVYLLPNETINQFEKTEPYMKINKVPLKVFLINSEKKGLFLFYEKNSSEYKVNLEIYYLEINKKGRSKKFDFYWNIKSGKESKEKLNPIEKKELINTIIETFEKSINKN